MSNFSIKENLEIYALLKRIRAATPVDHLAKPSMTRSSEAKVRLRMINSMLAERFALGRNEVAEDEDLGDLL